MEIATFKLGALTCPSCLVNIKKAVSEQSGVSETKVLFNAGKVKATYDSSKISADQISKIIESLGYPVENTKMGAA